MNSRAKLRILAIGASPLVLMWSTHAYAQAATPAAGASDNSDQVAEIVVTANRREQSLKDVPISVQAITEAQMNSKAISDTADLAAVSPTLNFATGSNAGANLLSLRGVSSLAQQNGIQPSTAMVVDGVPVARQAEFVVNLGDVERIEIINGPQGTLFGKNSSAGVVSIVSHRPTDKLEGLVEGLVTNDSEYGIRAMANVPLSDRVRLRVNGFYRDQKPLIKNFGPAPDVRGVESYGVNAKLALDLTDDVTFDLSGTYSHTNSSAGQLIPIGGNVFGALFTNAIAPSKLGRGGKSINTNQPAVDIYETRNVTGTLNWQLTDDLKLISISSYNRLNDKNSIDIEQTPFGVIVGVGESTPGVAYPYRYIFPGLDRWFPDKFNYVSQEVRLNYTAGPANAILGAYYQNFHEKGAISLPSLADGSIFGLAPGTTYYSLRDTRSKIDDKIMSVFGDVTFALTDQLKVFGGLRYSHEKLGVVYHRDNYFGPASLFDPITGVFTAPPTSTIDTTAQNSVNNLSGRAGIQFQPTEDLNFYGSYARGYKAPAADVGTSLVSGVNPIIKPEIATAFEVGAKLRLFENRLALNVTLFDQKIKGIQVGTVQPGLGLNSILINAGTLKSRGIEADAQWVVTREFRLSAGLAYNDATYGNFIYPCNPTQLATGTCPDTPQAGFQDIAGQQALGSPKYKYSIAGDYAGEFQGGKLGFYAHIDWVWRSSVNYQLGGDPLTAEPSYGLLSASVGIKSLDDRWEFQVFGKNLTNKFFYNNHNSVPIFSLPSGNLSRDFQRYGGVKLTLRY